MPIKIATIIQTMEWAASRGLSDISTSVSGAKIHLQRSAVAGAPLAADGGALAPARSGAEPTPAAPDTPRTIDAPMAGICHLSGEDGGAVFVSPGDKIEEGQTICLIEAMKMMTSVSATTSGTVKAILVGSGDTVNAGTPLLEVVQ